jgi:hypothetical protein
VKAPVGVLLAVLCVAGCAGPTYTDSAMRSQASRSASAAVSELETLRLVVDAQLHDHSWWQYTDVVVTDSERALSTIESTLASRQPPSADSGKARNRVVTALEAASDMATDLRIAVRNEDESSLASLVRRIEPLADRLSKLSAVVA